MNVQIKRDISSKKNRLGIIDCDVHSSPKAIDEIHDYIGLML